MTVQLESLVAACRLSGGAVPPPHVLALCKAVDQLSDLMLDMAKVIEAGSVTSEQLGDFADRMKAARNLEMAWPT